MISAWWQSDYVPLKKLLISDFLVGVAVNGRVPAGEPALMAVGNERN